MTARTRSLTPLLPSTLTSQAPSESEPQTACSKRASSCRRRLDKLLRSAKSYRTRAAGAVQTRSPLDGRSYSRHVMIEGGMATRSGSRSKGGRRTVRSYKSTSRFEVSPLKAAQQEAQQQNSFIKVSEQPSSSSLMFLSNTTPEYYESMGVRGGAMASNNAMMKSASPDFARQI